MVYLPTCTIKINQMWDGIGYEVQKSHNDAKSYFVWLFRQRSWWHICHSTTLKRLAWIFCLVRCSFSTRALKHNGREISTYVLPRTNSNHTSFWKNKKAETRERVLQNDVFHWWWSFHDVKLLTTSPYSSRTCLILNWIKFEKLQSIYPHFRAVSEKLYSFTFPKKSISPWDDAAQRVLPVWHRSRIPWRSAWGCMDRWYFWWQKELYICQGI